MAEARCQQDNSGGWISVPSIPAHRVAQGVLAFLAGVVIATAVDAGLITYNQSPGHWLLTAELVFDDGGSIVGWALAATWPLMEVFRMVLAGIYERRRREKALAEGFAAGREEGVAVGREEGIAIGEARAQVAAGSVAQAGSGAVADVALELALPARRRAMETQQRWLAWNLRRVRAEANGDIFVEEPPAGAALAAAGNLCVETHELWLGWNIRRLEAETRGVDFEEPPPGIGGGDSDV